MGVSLALKSLRGQVPTCPRRGQPSASVFLYFARESVRSVPQSGVVSRADHTPAVSRYLGPWHRGPGACCGPPARDAAPPGRRPSPPHTQCLMGEQGHFRVALICIYLIINGGAYFLYLRARGISFPANYSRHLLFLFSAVPRDETINGTILIHFVAVSTQLSFVY